MVKIEFKNYPIDIIICIIWSIILIPLAFLELEGIIDFAKEIQRLEKEVGKLAIELTKVGKKLENEGFLNKAPADVIEKVREKQTVLLEKQQKLQMNLDRIKAAEA